MKVIGIDPGTARTGYAICEFNFNKIKLVDYGVITTSSKLKSTARLKRIYDELYSIIKVYRPEVSAVEKLYFSKNIKTAMSVSEARGVILLCLNEFNIPVYEYTPLEVKSAIVGFGNATKKQVQTMLMKLLSLKTIPAPDDAADAIAICFTLKNNLKSKIKFQKRGR